MSTILHNFNQGKKQERDNFLLNKKLRIKFLLYNHAALPFKSLMVELHTESHFLVLSDGITMQVVKYMP